MITLIITGPSGSGKTFLSKKLLRSFKNSIVINTDSYYRSNLYIKFLSLFRYDIYDRLISIKTRELRKTINSIYNKEKLITFYNYDFKTRKSTKLIQKINYQNDNQYMIVEGVFSHRLEIDYVNTIRIFCMGNREECYERRKIRDQIERGRTIKEVKMKFDKTWDLYFKHINKDKKSSQSLTINPDDEFSYEELVNRLKIISNKYIKGND